MKGSTGAVPLSRAMRQNIKSLHSTCLALGARLCKETDYAIDRIGDAMLGIDTFARVPVAPDMMARNIQYDPLPYRSLQVISRHLPRSGDDEIVDLGCGKGRVLCFFALGRLRKCSGIEILQDLADQAQMNARRLHRRHTVIEVAQGDAINADIGDASIIYMFNPFSAEVMEPVLRAIERSLWVRPRCLRVCYVNPAQAALLDACTWLTCVDSFVVTWSGWHTCPVKIWTACSGTARGR